MTAPCTFSSLVAAFGSFLTVSIHTILHQRSLYPQHSFLRARAYNYPVYQSRHPLVCTWIIDAVAAVEAELLRTTLDAVVLVIYSPSSRALERFVWNVSRFPVIAQPRDYDTPFVKMKAAGPEELEDIDLEEQFRATLAKLSTCSGALAPLPVGCTFNIAIELKDEHGVDPPVGHPNPWIPAQPDLQATRKSGLNGIREKSEGGKWGMGQDLGGARTTPVRSVKASYMLFELWIEEGKAKLQSTTASLASSKASSTDDYYR